MQFSLLLGPSHIKRQSLDKPTGLMAGNGAGSIKLWAKGAKKQSLPVAQSQSMPSRRNSSFRRSQTHQA
jgi:hypothetical protein